MIQQGRITTGERTCGRIVADPERLCGEPAVGHFMWTDDGDNGIACERHTPAGMLNAVDWHPLGDDCTMPGVQWRYSTSEGAGRCEWPHEAAAASDVADELVAS
jgi:hypothetical protein